LTITFGDTHFRRLQFNPLGAIVPILQLAAWSYPDLLDKHLRVFR